MRMRSVAITCYNEITKERIGANLLIARDFLGSLEKKRIFATVN